MSELSDYKVEPGDPDPRGWDVVTADGRKVGRVEDLVVDTTAMKVRHLIVEPTSGAATSSEGTMLLNTTDVDLRDDSRQVVARAFPGYQAAAGTTGVTDRTSGSTASREWGARDVEGDRKVLTRAEEELKIGKREVSAGEAKVSKHVETEHVSQPVTKRREEVVIERRPVEAGARGDASISEDEIRVPLMEEEVIVEKRPVVKEELVVGKRIVEERDTVEADVKREEFDVDDRSRSNTPPRGTRGDGR